MNGGFIPTLLLCATIALMLSFTNRRVAWFGLAGMTATAAVLALIALPPSFAPAVLIGVFATIIVAAALTYLPPALARSWAIPLAVVAGAEVGMMASLSGRKIDLLFALPLSLLFLPGRWIVARGYGLGIKIVASWMIAIALLSTFVSMTPTPGYQADHRE